MCINNDEAQMSNDEGILSFGPLVIPSGVEESLDALTCVTRPSRSSFISFVA